MQSNATQPVPPQNVNKLQTNLLLGWTAFDARVEGLTANLLLCFSR